MDLKKEINIINNERLPNSNRTDRLIVLFEKHTKLSNLIAIQNYLLEHGSNDEKINDQIKELRYEKNHH